MYNIRSSQRGMSKVAWIPCLSADVIFTQPRTSLIWEAKHVESHEILGTSEEWLKSNLILKELWDDESQAENCSLIMSKGRWCVSLSDLRCVVEVVATRGLYLRVHPAMVDSLGHVAELHGRRIYDGCSFMELLCTNLGHRENNKFCHMNRLWNRTARVSDLQCMRNVTYTL